jgi:hypothetical protein
MSPFEQAFPGFVKSCTDLNAALLPWAMVLLIIAFAVEFWHGPPSPARLIQFIVLVFFVILLLAKSHQLVNDLQVYVQQWVEQNIPARPENVAIRYQELLASAQNAPADKDVSFWDTLFSANWFEAIIYAVLTLISWLAMAVLSFVYSVQRAVLLLCWAISPLLFPCLAIRPVSHLGLRHFLRILAVEIWPIGLALAATCTEGLLDAAAAQDFVGGGSGSVVGSLGYGLKTLLAVGVVAIWIIFSSILAPVFIQRLIVGSAGPAGVLSQAASLISTIALPSLFGVPAAARSVRHAASSVMVGAGHLWQRALGTGAASAGTAGNDGTLTALPMMSPPPPTGKTWQPAPSDPTGDQFVRRIADEARKQ